MRLITLLLCVFVTLELPAQKFNFLGGYDSQGVPDYLEPGNDLITQESMQMIMNALPESYAVPQYNPHYITAGYDTDIALQKDAAVWVTFVREGAAYKNVLGFYTYDLADPSPSRPEPSDITIIFPNASEGGYGGGLRKGNKVKIGDFPAGTGIGWVLLADAWNGHKVTSGLWQVFSNPKYNPEADEALRHHMVLLSDPENERIYLGIEDIRRDFQSCDQDFNDAIFFVTANPYEAIKTYNYADVDSSKDVSSGNTGGLESNGKLAQQIAQRNFGRLKNSTSNYKKAAQKEYSPLRSSAKSYETMNLASLLPQTGMTGKEEARISSPEDLLGITNAEAVFSADYYQDENRVAAALCTKTTGRIYDHSKVICDRLNSSSLEDIRTIKLKGHELVMIKIRRASGQLEYAVNFSINKNNQLYSFWNISDYPAGDYVNFQVWGNSMGQVSSITNAVLDRFTAGNTLVSETLDGKIPTLFVSHGFYKDGQLHLTVKNKNKDDGFSVNGKIRTTELDEEIEFYKENALNTMYEEEISIASGNLFDAGLSIKGNNSPQPDALYLADGPWGTDFLEEEAVVNNFTITAETENAPTEEYRLERNVSLNGKIYGTLNVFRTILPGDLAFETEAFEAMSFNIKNSLPIEVILVTENLSDWQQRYRLKINANTSLKNINLSLNNFSNGSKNYAGEKLKSVVFSVQGDYKSFREFDLAIEELAFTSSTLSLEEKETLTASTSGKVYAYPNPFKDHTTLVIPRETETATVFIYDMNGRQVWTKEYTGATFHKELPVNIPDLKAGMYRAVILLDREQQFSLGLLVH